MKTVLFALVFTSCVGSLFAVECYTCVYSPGAGGGLFGGDGCNDPFNATSQLIVSCDGTCAKTSSRVNGEITALARACLPAGQCPEACASIGNTEVCVYCCTGDKCNGASTVTFGLMTACVTALAAWMNSA
ncbi:uncharacterized protein LOC117299077 [Asterias rubens]|uniref:uncharacterized protein LOC117299077 n=1 Tax=Asterias rubens TaxID=7604 RepID=UPI001455A61B|nr:uncharacterized protein LOC117299077 [Asterias rubens]